MLEHVSANLRKFQQKRRFEPMLPVLTNTDRKNNLLDKRVTPGLNGPGGVQQQRGDERSAAHNPSLCREERSAACDPVSLFCTPPASQKMELLWLLIH